MLVQESLILKVFNYPNNNVDMEIYICVWCVCMLKFSQNYHCLFVLNVPTSLMILIRTQLFVELVISLKNSGANDR